ncbi:MAG: hypothetical protein KBA03_00375 [Anaerolineaceae bacterium]|nr:hypothetical protein [Anaerolineaceae bacterium]
MNIYQIMYLVFLIVVLIGISYLFIMLGKNYQKRGVKNKEAELRQILSQNRRCNNCGSPKIIYNYLEKTFSDVDHEVSDSHRYFFDLKCAACSHDILSMEVSAAPQWDDDLRSQFESEKTEEKWIYNNSITSNRQFKTQDSEAWLQLYLNAHSNYLKHISVGLLSLWFFCLIIALVLMAVVSSVSGW